MFRSKPSKTDIKPGNFGIGSVIKGSPNDDETWLVVQYKGTHILLVNLVSFETYPSIEVDDPAYLTGDEARCLVNTLGLPYAFSDFSLLPTGLKDRSLLKKFKY